MNFSKQQADPRRHVVGLSFVVLLHVLVVYALVTGLAKKVVDVVRQPIDTKVIEEVKKPPPPPEIVVPPPPQMQAPPPPFIPPPEVQIQTPPPTPNVIAAVTATPPPAPTVIAPVQAAPVQQTGPLSAGVVCPNHKTVMGEVAFPRDAIRQGIDRGEALIEFTVAPSGAIKDAHVVSASNPIFARNSLRIISEYRCQGRGQDVLVRVPFSYKLE
jgi:protein TonB